MELYFLITLVILHVAQNSVLQKPTKATNKSKSELRNMLIITVGPKKES
jgi:hypothetical protein